MFYCFLDVLLLLKYSLLFLYSLNVMLKYRGTASIYQRLFLRVAVYHDSLIVTERRPTAPGEGLVTPP